MDGTDYATFASCHTGPTDAAATNLDGDGDVDLGDFAFFQRVYTGPDGPLPPGCDAADFDADVDVDLLDFATFQEAFTG